MACNSKVPVLGASLKRRLSPKVILLTAKYLRTNRVEILHSHYSPDYIAAGLAARLAKTPVRVMTRHLSTSWSPSKVRRNLSLYDHIIVVSESTRVALSGFGVPNERMTVAKMGIPSSFRSNADVGETRNRLGLSPDRYWVGSFGRLVPEKGVNILLNAIRLLPENFCAAIFGGGESLDELKSSSVDLGERVKFFGQVKDVTDAMAAVDAIAIPSIWAEAFPQSALEAMALGKPIAASNIGGLPEQIEHEVTGLLFEPGNPSHLATALRRFYEEPERALAWALAARKVQSTEYTIEKFAERTEAVYKKLMSGPSGSN